MMQIKKKSEGKNSVDRKLTTTKNKACYYLNKQKAIINIKLDNEEIKNLLAVLPLRDVV